MARRFGSLGVLTAFTALAAACLLPAPAAAEGKGALSLSSRSYLLAFEREDAAGGETNHLPLYEYLSLDATEVGGVPVSAHFYGMGRIDLRDDTGSGPESGDVGAFFVEYRHPTGGGEAKAGRFFLAEGGAFETIDGAFVKGRFPGGVGLALFGGKPVEQGGAVSPGDVLYGARAFLARAGAAELGVSCLREQGDFPERDGSLSDRTLASVDLWTRVPALPVELSGRADYELATEGFSRKRLTLRARPATTVDLSVGYDGYDTKNLSHGATNGAFLRSLPAYSLSDQVDVLSFAGSWQAAGALSLDAAAKAVRHSEGVVGDAALGTLGARLGYNDGKDSAGADVTVCRGDRGEDRFNEFRLFATWSPGKARFTADALADYYEEEIVAGRPKESYQVTGTASLDVTESIRVGGDVRWTDGPRLSDDLALLARVSMGFSLPTGGTK
jgi:hypothetical protein